CRSGIAQRTLYRLRSRWEQHGIAGLLPDRPGSPSPRLDDRLVRNLLVILRDHGAFALGTTPAARSLIPQCPDPLLAGRSLAAHLQRFVAAVDSDLAAVHQIPHLLQRRLLLGEPSEAIADTAGLSSRSIQRILTTGLHTIAVHLSTALSAHPAPTPWTTHLAHPLLGRDPEVTRLSHALVSHAAVQCSGLSGLGKSSVAASLAARWEAAGWYVAWVDCAVQSPDRVTATVEGLQQQLLDLGLLGSQHLDPSRPQAERLQTLRRTVRDVPLLLVLDNVQAGHGHPGWVALLTDLAALGPSVHVLLVGQRALLETALHVPLEGLSSAAARALYTTRHGAVSDQDWQKIHAHTLGYPKLIELVDPTQPAALQTEVVGVLKESVLALDRELRRALLWLRWGTPASPSYPAFIQAAQVAPRVWQCLARRGLVSLHGGQATMHDLVREHLGQVAPAHEWADVRRQVMAHALGSGDWSLVFHGAVDRGDRMTQAQAGTAAAQHADRLGQPTVAGQWWATVAGIALAQEDVPGAITARLHQVECTLQLVDGAATLAILADLPVVTDVIQHWWVALYRFEAHLMCSDYATAAAGLTLPPLVGAVPDGVGAVGAWRLALSRVWMGESEEHDAAAWTRYQRLPPPPDGTPLHIQLRFYRLGANLAMSQREYARCRQLSKQQVRLARRSRSAFCIAQSQMTYIEALYTSEQYAQAYTKLVTVHPTLPKEWTALERRASALRALLAYHLGKLKVAQHYAQAAYEASTALGLQDDDEFVLLIQGVVALGCGDAGGAIEVFTRGTPPGMATTRSVWAASSALQAGDSATARALFTVVLQTALRARARPWVIDLRLPWAAFQQHCGHAAAALRHYHRAVTIAEGFGLPITQAEALAGLTDSRLHQGHVEAALLASTAAVRCLHGQPLGLLIAPTVWTGYARALEAVGDPAAVSAWDTARRHLRSQVRQLPPEMDNARFLSQPHHRWLIRRFGSDLNGR
ncbi:MAG: helix-turn-helix domain-containing protein, partial [Herpetosiphonaceae bacterium]|nr:helix-turn-helix domain-containing protein [Herpetosiphonaceae bacterium]